MSMVASSDLEIGSIHAAFCYMVMGMRRYDTTGAGELLTVITINLLDKAGYNATISELVEITGLPESSVSRYVSRRIQAGLLTQVLDTQDRRRRHLSLTDEGRKEEKWHQDQSLRMRQLSIEALYGLVKSKDSVSELKKIRLSINARLARLT
jgi:DNA-binding MarR family transcriptional regulator